MREQEKLTILKDLVAINTVAANETSVAVYLQDVFKRHGIESQLVADDSQRANIVGEIGDGEGPV
ncbi:MAG TPA: succinyl-diaminopimelate desuccinylase, partial [Weissella confusa]|nr:succinyl-diaminopimelate desuccinylase [Weissella confusa]